MKNFIFKKLLILFVVSVILISSFSVVCFADVGSGSLSSGDVLFFNDNLSFSSFSSFVYSSFDFHVFDSSGVQLNFQEILIDPDLQSVTFSNSLISLVVYDGSWIEPYFQTVFVDSSIVLDSDFELFLVLNTHSETTDPIYDSLFNIFRSTFFGDRDLDPVEKLSITLLCLIICVAIICIPIVICYLILIGLSRIGVRYL